MVRKVVLFLLTLVRFGIIGLNIDVMTIILNLIAIAITLGSLTKAFTRPYSISKTVWGAVTSLWAWFLIMKICITTQLIQDHPIGGLLLIARPFYIIGPYLLYLFIVTQRPYHFSIKSVLIQITPFFLVLLDLLPFYTMPFEQKLEIIKHIEAKDLFTKTYGWFPHVWIPYMQSLLGVFYLGRVWKFVVKTQNTFAGEKLLSQWDVFFAVGFLLLYISNGYMYLLTNELLKDVDQMPFMNKISVIHTLMTFALFISYFVIKDSSLRTPVERSTEKYPLEEIEELAKISTTKVDKEPDIVNLQDFELIKNVLDKSKSYRNHKFTISELAMEVGIQPYAISNAINTVAKMNYNDFINSYRIKAFMQKVISKEYQNYTIEAIANECGFKSKSTFFTAFKKQTGLTPNQYLKKHDMELNGEE